MNNKILNLKELSQKAKLLPSFSGVYLMKDKKGNIIYIGKAKNLKNRVSSYFTLDLSHHEAKVKSMIQNVCAFDYIVTDSEFEALILECSLIKKHKPKYNILLKDSKGYSYIKITKALWPGVLCVKQKINDNAIYIGPYINSLAVKQTVEEILDVFKLPKCKRDLSKIYKKPCLYYHINKCCGPCIRKVSHEEYTNLIEEVKHFLQSGLNSTIKILTKKMNDASESMNFEQAAKLRDKIKALKNINLKQKVVSSKIKDQDIIAIVKDSRNVSIEVFRFKGGDLCESKNFILQSQENEIDIRTAFVKQFYNLENNIPDNVILDDKINDMNLINKMISQKASKKIKISISKSGESLNLVNMCKNNAYENLLKENKIESKSDLYLEDLKNILSLEKAPERIEAYDISNLSGYDCVGAMVVFKNGKPFKQDYRRFNISYSQDDYKSIKEVLKRRLSKFKSNTLDISFSKLPDLILIDGGTKHVSSSKEVLKELNLNIPVFGMVKDKKHHTKALTNDEKEIKIKDNSYLYSFITIIQNEVHRYAINYHKILRNKKAKNSQLTLIKGIGQIRSKVLLKKFKSIENISKASIKELENIEKMSASSARSVYNYFKNKKI